MNLRKTFWGRFRSLWQRPTVKREIDEELQFHLEQRTAENIAAGMSPADAAREARKRFGNVQSVREECRDRKGASLGETLWQDVRFGARMLRKSPGVTTVAVLMLALGIGGVTAVLSVFSGMFVELLPYKDAGQLVVFETRVPGVDRPITSTAAVSYRAWCQEADRFSGLAAYVWHTSYDPFEGWKDTEDQLKSLQGFQITPNFFDVLGVKPILGRTLHDKEINSKNDHVVILSHRVWQDRFGGDPDVLNRTVRVEGHPCQVIGVMPPNLRFLPSSIGSVVGLFSCNRPVDYWLPMPDKFQQVQQIDASFDVVGRLKPGVSLAAAQSQMDVLNARLFKQHYKKLGMQSMAITVTSLRHYLLGTVHAGLWLLLAAAGFVLLIACANVMNLLLIRNLGRTREMAVCAALGVPRWRWLRQRLLESSLIALGGGVLGSVLAAWGTRLLVSVAPPDLPGLDQIRLNPGVLGITLSVTVICGLIVGLLPALQINRVDLVGLLKGGSGSTGMVGPRDRRILGSLGMVEVALALVLLLGATLTLHSFWRVAQVELGLNTDNILCARIMGPDLDRHQRTLLESLQGLPGVEAAATMPALPLTEEMSDFAGMRPTDWDEARQGTPPQASIRTISHDYFRAMGVQLLQGRAFNELDTPESGRVLVVNQRLARLLWPDSDPIGQTVRFDQVLAIMCKEFNGKDPHVYRIVGVVRDVKYKGPDAEAPLEVYLPFAQAMRQHIVTSLVLRCRSTPAGYVDAVKRQVETLCPSCSVTGFSTMRSYLDQRTSVRRFVMTLLLTFAGLALTLAVIGIYSVTACTVSARMREVGIRMALGADRASILKLMVKQGMAWVVGGLGLGLVLALALRGAISSQLFGISALDPLAVTAGVLLIVLVSLTACLLPARRAAKVDPMTVLRDE